MLTIIRTSHFKKDVKKAIKRSKNLENLKSIMQLLSTQSSLPSKLRNHKLSGEWHDCWECHIEPDWLLIYALTDTEIIFVRTGTHSDLF